MEAPLRHFEPVDAFDLVTCVHGLHYVGDKLGLVARAAPRLVEDGWFAGGHPEPGGVGGDERPGARAVS